MKNCDKSKIIKALFFWGLFVVIFSLIQHIFIPKWYYPDQFLLEPVSRIFPGFYEEEEDSIDVIILGASSAHYGISPMEMYESYNIKSYNLATPGQPIEVSYYALKEALRKQKPKVVVLEVTSLFGTVGKDASWRYVIDSIPLSGNKFEFAIEYSKLNNKYSIAGALVPLYQYHERWKELTERDFTDFSRNKKFYSKGYGMFSGHKDSNITQDEMNDMAELLEHISDKKIFTEYINGDKTTNIECKIENIDYINNFSVSKNSLEWLMKIKDLCLKNNIALVTTKIPVVYAPNFSSGVWTQKKHDLMSSLSRQYDIEFVDMQYDENIGIDWKRDTHDGGKHLNFYGAQKASIFLGKYLTENYRLSVGVNDIWEEDLHTYKQARSIKELQLEIDFCSYIKRLSYINREENLTIFISASDEMSLGLNEEDKRLLYQLGLQTDFSDKYRYAYLAIIEGGTVIYEGISNDKILYEGKIEKSDIDYKIVSSGYYTNPSSHILIGNTDWSVGKRGLNIVVYDNERKIVLDSVCFDTCNEDHTINRLKEITIGSMREYESFIIENEARR